MTDQLFHNKNILGKNEDLKEFVCAKGISNCFNWFNLKEIGRELEGGATGR